MVRCDGPSFDRGLSHGECGDGVNAKPKGTRDGVKTRDFSNKWFCPALRHVVLNMWSFNALLDVLHELLEFLRDWDVGELELFDLAINYQI